ncbi:MAG: DUF1318 domain-containing protein [Verrucomicrobia bacterium]|nr:DUF1318 domain-containing protein [Verrucomicrobiota bacterium]
MLKLLTLLLPCLLCLSAPALAAQDQSPEAIRKRMEANLPRIDALKKAGKVGETNRAYLEARAPLEAADKELVKIENADRKAVYESLAQRAQASLEQIERTRAEQIRRRSTPGVWLQDAKGKWYRK